MPVQTRNSSRKFLSGKEVKAWRLSRRFSQPELAEFLGLTAQAVGKYELVGATRATALALSAIDRGLRPFKPTPEDLAAIDPTVKRIRSKEY